jgi:CheY-like chemotaxis protein
MSEMDIMPANAPRGESLPGGINPPPRILVADDEACMRLFMTDTLGKSGYDVDAAKDGADAWEALQAKHYDLLITDNNMPKVSGVELIQRLHASRNALPVIMATGSSPDDEFTKTPWLQPFATLLKPFRMADFLETVQAALPACGAVR